MPAARHLSFQILHIGSIEGGRGDARVIIEVTTVAAATVVIFGKDQALTYPSSVNEYAPDDNNIAAVVSSPVSPSDYQQPPPQRTATPA